jgi:hypothetical protein
MYHHFLSQLRCEQILLNLALFLLVAAPTEWHAETRQGAVRRIGATRNDLLHHCMRLSMGPVAGSHSR